MKKRKKAILLISVALLVVAVGIFFFNQPSKERVLFQDVEVIPLSPEERQKVFQTVSSSEFIKDIPEKNPIALTFYDFENGQRRWRDGFLINKNGFLSEGEPVVYLTLHTKYISEINEGDLCKTIKKAKENGDLGFHSEYNKARLLIKYASMLKHRGCFGF